MVKLRFDKIFTEGGEDFSVPLDHRVIQQQLLQQQQLPDLLTTAKSPVTKIYPNVINGKNLFNCPFCDADNFVSGIRFRKHLKQYHPGRDTFIVNTPKEPPVNNVSLESILKPTLILPKLPSNIQTAPSIQLVQASDQLTITSQDVAGFNSLQTENQEENLQNDFVAVT